VGEDSAFVAPVDLGLSARDDFEPAVQPAQRTLIGLGQLGGDPRPGGGHIPLDPLVVASEAVLGDQPLVDHAGLQCDLGPQPGIHHRREPVDLARLSARP
jgi:hypothetical protein